MTSLLALRPFSRFRHDRRGVSAVEFALLLPVMASLYLGGVQISDALTVARKVTHASSALGDLVTQSKILNNADMKNILDATAAIMAPYSASTLKIKISGVTIDNTGKATVTWSDARNDTPLKKGDPVAVPAGIKANNTFLVTAELHYPYKPTIGYVLTGNFDLTDQFWLRPRLTDTITRTN